MSWQDDEINEKEVFLEGVQLFNDSQWFDAHDAWEEVWRLASGDRKRFYQGLIMCAYTIEHVRRGNPRGVKVSYASVAFKFKALGVINGVDTQRLQKSLLNYIQPVLKLPRGRFVAGLGRGQEMPVSLDDAPLIEIEADWDGELG